MLSKYYSANSFFKCAPASVINYSNLFGTRFTQLSPRLVLALLSLFNCLHITKKLLDYHTPYRPSRLFFSIALIYHHTYFT